MTLVSSFTEQLQQVSFVMTQPTFDNFVTLLMICPHKCNRVKPPTQDSRKLRRYRRRWKIERLIAWLGNFRRLVVRYERNIQMYQAFCHLACLIIVLRQL